jgi:glycerophosphoryl diester phosphodiesterase
MGYAPENTLISFAKALDLGVNGIELDVHLCRSGELVVIHDSRVERTTNGKGRVSDLTLEQLKTLDAGMGETIPSLREVLDLVDRKAFIDIELKGEGSGGPVADLIGEYLTKGWKARDFMITSFDHHELKHCHDRIPQVPFGPLLAAKPLKYAELAEDMGAEVILPFFEFLDLPFVQDAHQRNVKVFTWTVNSREDIQKLRDWGVDGMISNFPERLTELNNI